MVLLHGKTGRMCESKRDRGVGSTVTMNVSYWWRVEGGGEGARRWRGKGLRALDGRNKSVCRGAMVFLNRNELKMDAAANVQTSFRQG